MTFVYTDAGRNFFENATIDDTFTEEINTIAIGEGGSAPDSSDTLLDNQLYEETDSTGNVTIERASGIGEIRATIEFTGGTEVPSGSDIREFGFKTTAGTLIYRELRSSAITVASGETKIVELRIFVEDAASPAEQVITNVGLEFAADRAIGLSSDYINTIAVGDGTGSVSSNDTTLANELYRNDRSGSNTILSTTTNVGEARAEITISAGADATDEVTADSDISEFGLFTNGGTLVLHEKRPAVTLEQDDTKTFKIPFSITQ